MIVSVEEIRSEGLTLDRELGVEFLTDVLKGDGPETGLKPAGPAMLHARFEKVSGKILLTANTNVRVAGACRRCLGTAQADVPVKFQLSLTERPHAPKSDKDEGAGGDNPTKDLEGSAATFDIGAVEEEVFSGHTIDLGGLVREQILLALPMSLLCRDECKGLCTVCGKDLNEAECGCERTPTDPRWAALKDIKLT